MIAVIPCPREQINFGVDQMLLHLPYGKVLDLGANTGHYSFAAAMMGNDVIATDNDHDCVQLLPLINL